MAITDKTRKLLWGGSGSKCAKCRRDLILDTTQADAHSVVGEECHIVSAKKNGPRHEPSWPEKKFDRYENLILLCRVHHKQVDDQSEEFNVGILKHMKLNHEAWVSEKLKNQEELKPLKFRRIKANIPDYLSRLTTGKEVLEIVSKAYAYTTGYDELGSEEEVQQVSEFFQIIGDADILDELGPGEKVKTAFELTRQLEELERAGFYVFGGIEIQSMEGGVQKEPSQWQVAHLMILRKHNDSIIKVNPDLAQNSEKDSSNGKP